MRRALMATAALAVMSSAALADGYERGPGPGIKDMGVPAPIPIPAPIPVQEGFTYYMRGDLGYGWPGSLSFSETGALYGEDSVGPVTFTSEALSFAVSRENIFLGTVGVGAYFTRWLRGDLTLDFRSDQEDIARAAYEYAYQPNPVQTIRGTITDAIRISRTAALANLYVEPLPRGLFTPYAGAGIGLVYNDVKRTYQNFETLYTGGNQAGFPVSRGSEAKENDVGLAAALMAGVAIAFDHRWAIDVGYRAMYLDGVSVTTTRTSPNAFAPIQTTTTTIGNTWEHQVRIGVRVNIW